MEADDRDKDNPVLETRDLHQTPSLQEGEVMLVLKKPVHHANPVLETGDLQQTPSLQKGELLPLLQEEELVPSLQEEETLALQEGEDVLGSEDPVHHTSPVKADMQGEETSHYYKVFLYKPLGREQDNLFVLMPFCVLRIYTTL